MNDGRSSARTQKGIGLFTGRLCSPFETSCKDLLLLDRFLDLKISIPFCLFCSFQQFTNKSLTIQFPWWNPTFSNYISNMHAVTIFTWRYISNRFTEKDFLDDCSQHSSLLHHICADNGYFPAVPDTCTHINLSPSVKMKQGIILKSN